MRTLLARLIVAALTLTAGAATPAYAGFSLIRHTAAGTSSANAAVTTTAISTTGADLLVAVVSNNDATGQATVSDSAGNTWSTTTRRSASGAGAVQVFYVYAPTTSGSHTVTVAAVTSSLASVTFMAFSGASSSPVDQQAGSTSTTTGSITPTQDGELVVVGYQDAGSGTITSTSPFLGTGGFSVIGGNRYAHFTCFWVQGTAASVSQAINANVALSPSTTIVSFKPAAGGGGGGESAYTFIR